MCIKLCCKQELYFPVPQRLKVEVIEFHCLIPFRQSRGNFLKGRFPTRANPTFVTPPRRVNMLLYVSEIYPKFFEPTYLGYWYKCKIWRMFVIFDEFAIISINQVVSIPHCKHLFYNPPVFTNRSFGFTFFIRTIYFT